jgi:hypothetical protein
MRIGPYVAVVCLATVVACGGGGHDTAAEKTACSTAASDADSANNEATADLTGGDLSQAASDFERGASSVRDDVAPLDSNDKIRVAALHLANAMSAVGLSASGGGAGADAALGQLKSAGNQLVALCHPLVPDIH